MGRPHELEGMPPFNDPCDTTVASCNKHPVDCSILNPAVTRKDDPGGYVWTCIQRKMGHHRERVQITRMGRKRPLINDLTSVSAGSKPPDDTVSIHREGSCKRLPVCSQVHNATIITGHFVEEKCFISSIGHLRCFKHCRNIFLDIDQQVCFPQLFNEFTHDIHSIAIRLYA